MNIKNNSNIAIIGTGFSSLISTLYLVSKRKTPIVIDIGTKHTPSKGYVSIFRPYFYNKEKEQYSYFGGLSNVWKGVVSVGTYKDQKKIGVKVTKKLLIELFNLIKDYSFFTNKKNYKNKISLSKISIKQALKLLLSNEKIFEKPLFLFNKYNQTPFKTTFLFKKLIKNKKIKYIYGDVNKFEKLKKKTIIYYKDKRGNFKKLKVDKTFCGAGAFSSYQIIKNSLKIDQNLPLKFSKKLLLLSTLKNKDLKIETDNSFPLFQSQILKKNGETAVYMQTYQISQIILNMFTGLFYKILKKIFDTKIFSRILISYISIPVSNNEKIKIINNKTFKKINKSTNNKNFKLICQLVNSKQNIINLYNIGLKLPSLAGNHFGSFLKYFKNKRSLKLKKFNNSKNLENVYFIDASIFDTIPAVPPTMLSMMYALSITKQNDRKVT